MQHERRAALNAGHAREAAGVDAMRKELKVLLHDVEEHLSRSGERSVP